MQCSMVWHWFVNKKKGIWSWLYSLNGFSPSAVVSTEHDNSQLSSLLKKFSILERKPTKAVSIAIFDNKALGDSSN